MSTRTVLFLVIFFVFAFVSEQAPSKLPVQEGSGEPPDVFENDKNLQKVPPFQDPALKEDDYDPDGIYAAKINGRRIPPPDYENKSPADSDYNRKFNEPEKSHETSPDFDKDKRPFDDRDVNDEDNEIHKNEVDEESVIDKTENGDFDEQEGGIDHSFDDRNPKIPIDEDEDVDESRDDDRDIVDVPKIDEVPKKYPGVGDFDLFFDTPFFNVRQVKNYFQQLEKALEQVFRQTMDEAMLLNGTYANTTEEEVEINGKKYVVQKSIIKGRDNNSSIYIEALSTVPKTNETRKIKDSGL